MSARPMIEVHGLWKAFGDTEVLKGVDLVVHEGETFVLLGGSGSGKTVLMKHLDGLLEPDAGTVRIDGRELSQLDERGLEEVRKELGILFQAGALFDSLTAFDNVALPLRELAHLPPAEVDQRVTEALELLGLSEAAQQFPGELSGGMRKRLAFARAVVLRPKILLYDEPTAGLDPLLTKAVGDVIIAAREKLNATTFAISHDLPTAFRIADTIGLLSEGRIAEALPPDQFRASENPAVKAFLRDWLARERLARETG